MGRKLTVRVARIVIAALVTAGLAGCGSSSTATTTADHFVGAVRSSWDDGRPVSMSALTQVDWDGGVFACPTDSVEEVEHALGAHWSAPSDRGDRVAYLLLADGPSMVDESPLDRSTVDPCVDRVPIDSRTFTLATEFDVGPASARVGWVLARRDVVAR